MTAAEIHECLEKLGKTADEVHTSLLVMGIRGRRNEDYHCPIANYIKAITNENHLIRVGRYTYQWRYLDEYLPAACKVFVSNFDWGCYPDLIAI